MRAFVTRNTERCEAGAEPGSQAVGCSDEGEDFLFCYFLQHSWVVVFWTDLGADSVACLFFAGADNPSERIREEFPRVPAAASLWAVSSWAHTWTRHLWRGCWNQFIAVFCLFVLSHHLRQRIHRRCVGLYLLVMILSGGVRCMISYMWLHWTFAADFTTGWPLAQETTWLWEELCFCLR